MNSSEVARLAGVTVRTLRHYHRLGVLPEPPRSANGYRSYGAGDVALLLRVRHLVDLGVPLARVGELLDDAEPQTRDDLLAEIETDLERRVADLTRQRDLVRRVRTLGSRPDLPPHLAEPLLLLARRTGATPEAMAYEQELALLLDRLLGEEERGLLPSYYADLAASDLSPRYVASLVRWDALDEATDPAERDAVVREIVELSRALLPEQLDDPGPVDDVEVPPLVAQYLDEQMNPTQREVHRRVMAELGGGPVEERG